MASVNKVILVGNCGRDAEVRYTQSGTPIANVSLATSSRRRDRAAGNFVEDTQWHNLTFYDRLADLAGKYVRKGRPIYVEGRIKYGKYKDKSGVERNTVDIIVTELQLLGSREDGNLATVGGSLKTTVAPTVSAPPLPPPLDEWFDDGDVPFA